MSLPLIVAGPIVRRVEPNLVTIWVAMSRPGNVHVTVFEGLHQHDTSAQQKAFGAMHTKAFGANLHVAAVMAVTDDLNGSALAPNTTYSYNVTFAATDAVGGSFTLESMGLLDDEDPLSRMPGVDASAPLNLKLGYVSGQLPSFVTCPSTLEDLVLMQAGCRNTGSSPQDAAGWLDEAIGDHLADGKRPHQLLMTGDQIYADSANHVMLPLMHDLGAELLGLEGHGPNIETLMAINAEIPMTMVNFPAYRRGWLCKDYAGFTTGSASHLLSYAEFVGAYCMAWNPSVWRDLPSSVDIFTDESAGHPASAVEQFLTPWSEFKKKTEHAGMNAAEWEDAKLERFNNWIKKAEVYRQTIPRVRRALANCATYMIFDDHEVTDDWNMSREWQHRVYSTPLGRRVLRNALSAYAVFQDWGNDPAAYTSGDKQAFIDRVATAWWTPGTGNEAPGTGDEVPDFVIAEQISASVGLPSGHPGDPPVLEWHYKVDAPAHQLVVIDTRTKRSYATHIGPARLLGDTLNTQVPAKGETEDRLLVVMAAQPPLMPALFDQIAQPLGSAVVDVLTQRDIEKKRRERLAADKDPTVFAHEIETGGQLLEAESWGLEEFGLEFFLQRIEPYKKVLIVSGDVHFSCALTLDYWKKDAPAPARIIQLIMSPCRHEWPHMVHDLMRTSSLSDRFAQLGMPAERLGWTSKDNTPVAPQAAPGIAARADRSPALLPAKGWPAGTTLKTDAGGAPIAPDWTWRLKLAVDERAETERPASIRLPQLETTTLGAADPAPGDHLSAYYKLAASHQTQTTRQFSHLRRLVFPTAVGRISFPVATGGAQQVQHEIWTGDPQNPSNVNRHIVNGLPNTVHVLDLEPTTEDEPTLQIGTPGEL